MDAFQLASPERKLVMWYKCKELLEKKLSKAQISRELGIDVKTVRRYLGMSHEDFLSSQSYQRMYIHILDPYEDYVKSSLELQNDLSSSQIHDWLRERYPNLPKVNNKTVFNFVKHIRLKYNIDKSIKSIPRQYGKVEETAFGEFAQADFGEMWMKYEDGRKLKVYFFVMVMSSSRKKYVFFSRTPFTSELAVYAHEKAFEYYGGKPKKIIYDQDSVLIHDENLGDCILTKAFQAFVNQEHFECVFCRKADPESKGKVENAVKYVKYNFLRGRRFVSIDQLYEEGIRWLSRTANGLPHCGTLLIPDEVFEKEKAYLTPYYHTPMMPEKPIREYSVRKNNVIEYHGNSYSLPYGTYSGHGSTVWLNEKDDNLELYDKETGKQIVVHKLSMGKGKYILEPSHRIKHCIAKEVQESEIMEYCNYDDLALEWMINLNKSKPRYYKVNLKVFIKGMRHFEPSTLHHAFEKCLDSGMYNAKDFMTLCDRIGKRIPTRVDGTGILNNLPAAAKETPAKTRITIYDKLFS
jgi:transposase